ncbi:hypothetical protein UFOVP140_47 [uncultured Caudovirales phage]|jgi:hypothetical protein|uniref:Bbp19-like phage domain-containing protein n=1 Tax=uncultured Caudovirales phage TaxID=2100421 RepID=A0A6J5LIN5_9CAUD|nr:hypothetical protein UFOVP140_47 [uncultured Caudovirales phage]
MSNQYDPIDLRAQERSKATSEAAAKLAQVNEAEDFKWLMSNKRGRRIVWRWLEKSGAFRQSFNHSGSITAFNEGARTIGLMLIAQINEFCPEQYLTMLQEQRKND